MTYSSNENSRHFTTLSWGIEKEAPQLLHLFRNAEGVAAAIHPSALESLNQDEKAGWKYLTTQVISTAQAYAEELGFDERKTQRHLRKFMELGLIRRMGQGRATRYEVCGI